MVIGENTKIIDQLDNQAQEALGIVLLVSMFISSWLYSAGLEASRLQGTVGNLIFGLKVTDEKGQRCTLGRTTVRFFSKILSALTLGFGYLMIIFTKRKQALHDILAKTLVVKR